MRLMIRCSLLSVELQLDCVFLCHVVGRLGAGHIGQLSAWQSMNVLGEQLQQILELLVGTCRYFL